MNYIKLLILLNLIIFEWGYAQIEETSNLSLSYSQEKIITTNINIIKPVPYKLFAGLLSLRLGYNQINQRHRGEFGTLVKFHVKEGAPKVFFNFAILTPIQRFVENSLAYSTDIGFSASADDISFIPLRFNQTSSLELQVYLKTYFFPQSALKRIYKFNFKYHLRRKNYFSLFLNYPNKYLIQFLPSRDDYRPEVYLEKVLTYFAYNGEWNIKTYSKLAVGLKFLNLQYIRLTANAGVKFANLKSVTSKGDAFIELEFKMKYFDLKRFPSSP